MSVDWRQKRKDRLLEAYSELDEKDQAEVLDTIKYKGALKAALEVNATQTVPFRNLYDNAKERQPWFNKFEGFGTGLTYFDEATMGFRPGEMLIIAGPSNFGKTMVSLNIVVAAAVNAVKRVLIVSMEMTKEEIASRLYNLADETDHENIMDNIEIQSKLKVNTDHIDHMIKRTQPDIVMVDVLQMLANQEYGGSEYERTNAAVAKVKHLALKHEIPIILVSHVAKTRSGQSGEATAQDLKGSSSIEQDSDQVIMINQTKEQRFANQLVVTLVKHRTKRPPLFHVPCVIDFNGIKVSNVGDYTLYSD